MTFLEIQNEVLAAGFAEGYRTRIKAWVNDAQSSIVSDLDIRTFQAVATTPTVAGTAAYNLPADFRRLRHVFTDIGATTDNVPLEPLDDPEAYDALPQSNGSPTNYTVKNAQIVLWPTPNLVTTLSIAYYRNPLTLAADGDVPELPNPPYHDALVEYATWHAFRREGDPDRAAMWRESFNESLAKLGTQLQHDTYARPPRVLRGAWG